MLALPVAPIDYRRRAHFACSPNSAFLMVPYDNPVGVCTHDSCGVLYALSLDCRGELPCVLGAHNLSSEPQHRYLEAEPCPCAGLVEYCGQDFPLKASRIFFRVGAHVIRIPEKREKELPVKLLRLYEMPERSNAHQKQIICAEVYKSWENEKTALLFEYI